MQDPEFENEHVCVWKTLLSPDSPLPIDGKHVLFSQEGESLMPLDPSALTQPTEVTVVEIKTPKNSPLPNQPLD